MSRSRRVVLTGIGVISPLGLDLDCFRQALADGRSGVATIRSFDASPLPVRIAAEVQAFDARDFIDKKDRKSIKMMARPVQFAVAAARRAMEDAGLAVGAVEPTRLGLSFGMSSMPGNIYELGPACHAAYDPATGHIDLRRWGRDGLALMPPMCMLNHVPNMAACHVSILVNAQGPSNTITQDDAASLLAPGEAGLVIRRGAADVMLAGGADCRVLATTLLRFARFTELSRRNDTPARACRPFDRTRDGQVLGEGATVLVLEALEHARRRGARIHGELLGFAAGFDPGRTGAGLARVIRQAVAEADLTPADLDHVNAHAPGTRLDDAREARAIHSALGEAVPVLAVKGLLGNLGAAASVTELAASLTTLPHGWRPGTLNYHETDPECPVQVLREPAAARSRCFVKIAATESGQCAAAVVRVGDPET